MSSELYGVEDKAKNLSAEERQNIRQQQSLPILQSFGSWMKESYTEVLPKSVIGKALAYSIQRWDALSLYVSDRRLSIDNNPVENQVRPVPEGNAPPLTLAQIQHHNNIYLLPTFERAKDIEKALEAYVKKNFEVIFLNELEGWDVDGETYPSLDYKKFTEWFEVIFHAMIYDIVDKPIKREKY
jgi:hypothetical protein